MTTKLRLLANVLTVLYIATWTAHWNTPATCENNSPRENPYTGEVNMVVMQTLQLCSERHAKEMARRFDNRQDAMLFIEACQSNTCTDWVLEEVHE